MNHAARTAEPRWRFGVARLVFLILVVAKSAVAEDDVPKFGLFEQSFQHAGDYENAYVEASATVEFTLPDGNTQHRMPLFWDGGKTWRFRVSPNVTGPWSYRLRSRDTGLDGHRGRFTVTDSPRQGSIRTMDGHPRHFQRQDGSPFWFLGDTAWALYTDSQVERHDRETAVKYVDARAEQGFNVLHSMLLSEAGWGNRGGPPFHDMTSQQINPGYWQEVDWRVAHVNRRGMVAGLAVAWGDKRKVEPYAWRKFPSLESRKRYARYIAARYSAFDVYFIVSGEWHAEIKTRQDVTEESVRRQFVAIGDALAEADPHQRMVAIHPMTRHGSVREFVGTRWMAFGDYQQNYRELHARILQSRPSRLPVVNSEYAYFLRDSNDDRLVDKDNSIDADTIRHATWDIAMAGGYVVAGFGTTYFGGHRDPGPFDVDATKNDVWEQQVQHVRTLLTSLEWWNLEPADDSISADHPRGADRTHRASRAGRRASVTVPPQATYWMMADEGHTYVAYVRGHTGPYQLKVSPGEYQVRPYDPRTGDFQPPSQIKTGETHTYRPPDSRDWVLVLQATD